ncbi:MAG: hypothetical protein M3R10_02625 [Verrucomicrobiota bacterium]|nr:hypothetical protein [Verrucomicrobiota bacterium]
MRHAILIGLLLFSALVFAAPNEQKEIQELYRRALAGDKDAVNQCIEKLESALATDSRNQLARVYLGSSYTLRSRDLGFGPSKLRTLRQGITLMDQAVAAAPDDPKVRLARALTDSALPAIFGRGSSSKRDFQLLAQIAKKNPERFDAADLQTVRAHAPAD